jgi:hypothetical protein
METVKNQNRISFFMAYTGKNTFENQQIWNFHKTYSSNEIRKTQNEHLIIIFQYLIGL